MLKVCMASNINVDVVDVDVVRHCSWVKDRWIDGIGNCMCERSHSGKPQRVAPLYLVKDGMVLLDEGAVVEEASG